MIIGELIEDAFIKNGQKAPGESIDAELADYALREVNRTLDQWNIQSLFVWTTNILVFDLTFRPPLADPDQTWYWMGPAAVGLAQTPPIVVDFDAPRPTRIERANLLLDSSNPQSRVPLAILDDMQWSDQTVPKLGTTIPTALYNDGANPISRLYVWPYPTQTQNQIELFVWNQVARFAALTDTFQMPPGYSDALMYTIAERTLQGLDDIPPDLAKSAAMARANVRSLNSRSPKMSTTDSGMPGASRGNSASSNYFNGWPTLLS